MSTAKVHCDRLKVNLDTGPDLVDISSGLQELVAGSTIQQGNLSATMTGSTGSLTTIEYEPGVIEDLKRAITEMALRVRALSIKRALREFCVASDNLVSNQVIFAAKNLKSSVFSAPFRVTEPEL